MGKHKKLLRSEKAKVKLRTKKEKDKLLPKGLNITNVTFKSKKINIQEQLKTLDNSLILSKRKLDVKALLSRLEHHNTKSRQESLKELKEILSHHSPESLISPLQPLLRGILSLTLDVEKVIRREAVNVLHLILSQIPAEKFSYNDIIVPYLGCTMSHINPNVREDSLLLLDTIVNDCNQLIIDNQAKIIPNLMDLISRMHSDGPRRLSTNLSAKTTTIKWTTKILFSLAKIFNSIVSSEKISDDGSNVTDILISDTADMYHIPLFVNKNLIMPYSINFNAEDSPSENSYNSQGFFSQIDQLIPLIFDSWVEVTTKESFDRNSLSDDETELLQSMVIIFQAIISYIDIVEKKDRMALKESNLSREFKKKFQDNFMKKIFKNLPYFKVGKDARVGGKKRQEDFGDGKVDGCDEQNLAICCIFAWFTKVKMNENKQFDPIDKSAGHKMIGYVSGKFKFWSRLDSPTQLLLAKVLNILFLDASEVWLKNNLPLRNILQAALEVYLETCNNDLKQMIFGLFENIAMDHTLTRLHSDKSFKKFVESLLPKLLSRSINQNVIGLLNNIVMRKQEWVRDYLKQNKDAIIENVKTIEVVGSKNVHESRLMLCNLFYFTDGMVYF